MVRFRLLAAGTVFLLTAALTFAAPPATAVSSGATTSTIITKTNPTDRTYPGGRGENDLVLYTPDSGSTSTGTNPYGAESVVRAGVVVSIDGNDSPIPADGFVVSGHGEGAEWVLDCMPVGAEVSVKGKRVLARITPQSLVYQAEQLLAKSPKPEGDAATSAALARELVSKASAALAAGTKEADARPMLDEAVVLARAVSYAAVASPTTEGRALWLRLDRDNPKSAHQAVESARALNANMLFPETIYWSRTINPPVEADSMPQHKGHRGTDPLRTMIDEGHAHGIEIHAWCEIFFIGPPKIQDGEPSLLTMHPEWLALDRLGRRNANTEENFFYVCPARPEVHEFLLRQLEGLAKAYELDGVQLDYIRYPGAVTPDDGFCYCDYCRKTFKAEAGADPRKLDPKRDKELWARWNTWREDRVTSFVQAAHSRLHAARPGIVVSAAVVPDPEESVTGKHQNWLRWSQKGWLDLVCTMAYRPDAKGVENVTREALEIIGQKPPIMVGLGPFLGFSADRLIEQIEASRAAGTVGQALFSENALTPEQRNALSTGPWKNKAKTGL
ncbi:hypothetical protein CVU37_09850 [candidate division BRC1 bacterium HGW-BRC1-1]|jgi:uncharacterized lipoprotein YddW (UPF0748 family)|nr:MAG: hypothetical protein CVU37_09850 [candidate division BRC1 bacterium HGW-BRC1-1]